MAPFFLLDGFLQYLVTEKRFSEHTCIAYKKDLEQFIEFTGIESEADLIEVNSRIIRGWMVSMLENEYTSVSVNRKLSTLRTYFKWLLKEEVIYTNPMRTVSGPKTSKRLPSFAQQQELQVEKIEPLFEDGFEGKRDRLIFELLYQTGIRSSELINLQDRNVEESKIKVLGKRNKERIIPISVDLNNLINEYRILRAETGVEGSFFFLLKSGKKLYPKFVYRKINSYLGKATELEKKSPHVLRHTFATHMLNNGAGLEVLKELLGHASLSATQVYTHNSFSQLTNIYSQSHPRGRKK
ncbi:MAG: tyrosine-type recombinase/integrase [Crocinitomicaceae bacterium]|nr:tyrosine-type recombinase/integrase [Crocinitomicaceae bacterium]